MSQDYIKPDFNKQAFTCPHCHTLAQMEYLSVFQSGKSLIGAEGIRMTYGPIIVAKCLNCKQYIIWDKEKYIYPDILPEEANPDMPDSVRQLYDEAGSIYNKSPRAACALLRLAVDKFCRELGKNDKDINKNIDSLVQKGLPPIVQKVLDTVRAIGYKAVQPGTIAFDVDNTDTVLILMKLLNIITQSMVSNPKQIEDLLNELPPSTRESIEKTNKNSL